MAGPRREEDILEEGALATSVEPAEAIEAGKDDLGASIAISENGSEV